MKEYSTFDKANEYVVNKDVAIKSYVKYMLARTQSMFTYEGLPETIPSSKLEMMLQTKGYGFVTEIDGNLYILHGSLTGEQDVYEDFTEINITNVALKLSKTFNIKDDGVLINNDTLRIGLLPILNKYGALLAENTISIRTIDIILRMVCMISASDDRTYTGAEKFIKDVENGKLSAIGESAFFDGIKVHSVANTQNYVAQFMELEQYLKASCFNEIGLNANYNMRAKHIGNSEAAMNDDFLLPLVDNMIKERQIAIDKINEKYGTEITIDYASSWKVTHEENEKQIALSDAIIEQSETGVADISVENHQGLHDVNNPTVFLNNGEPEHEENIENPHTDDERSEQNNSIIESTETNETTKSNDEANEPSESDEGLECNIIENEVEGEDDES